MMSINVHLQGLMTEHTFNNNKSDNKKSISDIYS